MAGTPRKVSDKKVGRPPRIRPNADKKERTYVCSCCGKEYVTQKENFPASQSNLYAGNGHYLTTCRSCIDKLYDHYCETLGNADMAVGRVCMKFDIYYTQSIVDASKKITPTQSRMQIYTRIANLLQYKGKTFDDYLAESGDLIINDIDDLRDNTSKVSQRMITFWGTGYSEGDLIALDNEYKDWTSRHECKTKAQEALFKSLSMAQLTVNKAYQSGDTKKIKEASDTLQSLMASANVKPSQKNDNALADSNTFGTLIKKWENTRPIGDPDPEWKDVDGIGHYFRVWVLGTILNMFNIKNPYQKEYDEEIKMYTAKKPEYEDDDGNTNDLIRQKVFGVGDQTGGDS